MASESHSVTLSACEDRLWVSALEAGYEVLHSGWPDFLLVKDDEVLVLEVKQYEDTYGHAGPSTRLKPNQLRMLKVLERCGLKVRICLDGDLNKLVGLDDPRVKILNVGKQSQPNVRSTDTVRRTESRIEDIRALRSKNG